LETRLQRTGFFEMDVWAEERVNRSRPKTRALHAVKEERPNICLLDSWLIDMLVFGLV